LYDGGGLASGNQGQLGVVGFMVINRTCVKKHTLALATTCRKSHLALGKESGQNTCLLAAFDDLLYTHDQVAMPDYFFHDFYCLIKPLELQHPPVVDDWMLDCDSR
jgi:hypothetical protein